MVITNDDHQNLIMYSLTFIQISGTYGLTIEVLSKIQYNENGRLKS